MRDLALRTPDPTMLNRWHCSECGCAYQAVGRTRRAAVASGDAHSLAVHGRIYPPSIVSTAAPVSVLSQQNDFD